MPPLAIPKHFYFNSYHLLFVQYLDVCMYMVLGRPGRHHVGGVLKV